MEIGFIALQISLLQMRFDHTSYRKKMKVKSTEHFIDIVQNGRKTKADIR